MTADLAAASLDPGGNHAAQASEDSMSRRTQTGAQPTQAPVATSAPVDDVNALRAQRKAISEQLKKLKAQTDGAITGVAMADDGKTFQIDVAIGDGTRRTGDGRPYLFSADGVKFTLNGVEYSINSIYAVATSKPK